MIASGTIIIDGQTYHKGDVIHDLGGWDCIDTDGSKRYYWGKSSEVDKLPRYDTYRFHCTTVRLLVGINHQIRIRYNIPP